MSTNKRRKRRFNIIRVVNYLFKFLKERERNILVKRYGLKTSKPWTLAKIGKLYNITRERVRQIEKNSIKKLKSLDDKIKEKSRFKEVNEYIYNLISKNGGVLEESILIKLLTDLHQKANKEILERFIIFMLHNLTENIEYLKPTEKRSAAWKIRLIDSDLIDGIIHTIVEIIEKANEPLTEKQLMRAFEQSEFYKLNKEDILRLCDLNKDGKVTFYEIFISYLKTTRKIKKNIFDKWGLIHWNEVQPKKITDKIYLVLKKANKPLHFKEITNLINKYKFDDKIACPATVHNELILNDQYVLVGRGIYALKEWGYKQGTVIDVIYNILEKAGKPLDKEQIVQEVLKNKIVKKSTIYLSLLDKNKFQKVGLNKYTIKK